MTGKRTVEELDLSDAELVEVLKDHGIDRRGLLKVFGLGAGVAALGGTAAGKNGRDARIDEVFGAAYSTDETPPPGLIDHEVELRVVPGDAFHEGFPQGDDTVDADPTTPGFQPDSDDQDDVPEFFFDPVGLHVDPGDVVHFPIVEAHIHTVTAFHPHYEGLPRRIPDGASMFTAPPIGGDESWLYRFETAGVYDIACLPHLPLGMVMRIVVGDGGTDWGPLPDLPGDPFGLAEAVLTDPELDPSNIVSQGEVAWSELSLP